MGNYIAMYVHLVWTTKYREPVLHKDIRYGLLDHIRVKAMENDINICILNGVEDHLHCLIALKATQAVSTVVKAIKGESSRWINEGNLIDGVFTWQDGYGAISVSPQDVPRITRYIFNQEQHHADRSLDEELQRFEQYAQD